MRGLYSTVEIVNVTKACWFIKNTFDNLLFGSDCLLPLDVADLSLTYRVNPLVKLIFFSSWFAVAAANIFGSLTFLTFTSNLNRHRAGC